MFKSVLNTTLSLANAIFMLKFATPKLSAADVSVKSFSQFAEVLTVNATAYMYFTGTLELAIALVFIASIFIKPTAVKAKVTAIGLFLLLGTLLGALATEFFVRPEPVGFLVQLSCIFITTSVIQFKLIDKNLLVKTS